ncbi:hypothetical protein G6F55_000673 [Rhizopus delemar]|uniref:Reverse transcriptase domain-containing protein n=2 Tax=Rhizopus TaxID=4842 RepID=A0A9P6ZCT3_9FUNG|nr:hypothetical protein G6F55_000673 [Rhizopus delemar]KAG1553950.1 hypothetical protein G6F51_000282 [Rhizopus arrhizus]KAG1528506.1 hypothetical protein G6F52_000583 [Rhizopus delemar]KAG1562244.1 hypothetical protein G6F49_001090 [Rhizopus delemar]KAG1575349.1 hypothetical protein G6F50_001168 [Rhizopus delemar]
MPIGFSSLQELANHPLPAEEIDSLLSTFSKERKRLICPNCNQQDHFRRHDSTKPDPPHFLFRCNKLPIHKKGTLADPGNFRLNSLTSIFRKTLELCLQNDIQFYNPPIDIVQSGFRECRGSLDQDVCLAEIGQILCIHHKVKPTLVFFDIKPAYDTVDRNLVW